MRLLLSLTALLLSTVAFAQPDHPIAWQARPANYSLEPGNEKEPAVMLLDVRRTEIQKEDESLVQYRTTHRLVRVLNDKGAGSFNTIYIPIGQNSEITDIHARTIGPDGQVVEVDKSRFTRTADENKRPQYQFAFEGLTIGSTVEFQYTERGDPSLYGEESYMLRIPNQHAIYELIVPAHLRFETKGYNGFPTAADSLMDDEVRVYYAETKSLPKYKEETASNDRQFGKRLAYRLSFVNNGTNKGRLFTWNSLASDLYDIYNKQEPRDVNAAKSWLRKNNIDLAAVPLARRIAAIEDLIKTEMNVDAQYQSDKDRSIAEVISSKVMRERDLTRLFGACFRAADIEYEVGLTANRFTAVVDDSFEIYSQLDEFLIYFPATRAMLAPAAMGYRYPWIPPLWTENKAVFAKETRLGDMVHAVAAIRTPAMMPASRSGHHTDVHLTFEPGTMTPLLEHRTVMEGYNALGIREVMAWGTPDQQRELVRGIGGVSDDDQDLKTVKVEHGKMGPGAFDTPVVIMATFRGPALLEKAGPKYLVKLGAVIGQQNEMYNDEDRTMPVDVSYVHSLRRTLRVTAPEGYRISNPEATRFDVVTKAGDGHRRMGFTADYTVEANGDLVVSILEDYNEWLMPMSDFQAYRKVVNAAADFNKVTLVLEKK